MNLRPERRPSQRCAPVVRTPWPDILHARDPSDLPGERDFQEFVGGQIWIDTPEPRTAGSMMFCSKDELAVPSVGAREQEQRSISL